MCDGTSLAAESESINFSRSLDRIINTVLLLLLLLLLLLAFVMANEIEVEKKKIEEETD